MFKKIQHSFLQKTLHRAGISAQVHASRHLDIARSVFVERFGEGMGHHVQLKYIKYRTLALEVAHPAVGQEIRQQEEAIISEINNRIGHPEVVRLQLLLPQHREENRSD